MRIEALDHELALIGDRIHQQGGAAKAFGFHQHQHALARFANHILCASHRAKRDNRHESAAHVEHLSLGAKPFDSVSCGAQAFDHMGERNDERLVAHLHDHPIRDGKGQRQGEGKGCSVSGCGIDGDAPAKLFHILFHHIHADPAARYVGHRGGG